MEKKKNVPQGILRTMQDDIKGAQLNEEQVFTSIAPSTPSSNQKRTSQNKTKPFKPEISQGGLSSVQKQIDSQDKKGPTPIAVVPAKKQKPKTPINNTPVKEPSDIQRISRPKKSESHSMKTSASVPQSIRSIPLSEIKLPHIEESQSEKSPTSEQDIKPRHKKPEPLEIKPVQKAQPHETKAKHEAHTDLKKEPHDAKPQQEIHATPKAQPLEIKPVQKAQPHEIKSEHTAHTEPKKELPEIKPVHPHPQQTPAPISKEKPTQPTPLPKQISKPESEHKVHTAPKAQPLEIKPVQISPTAPKKELHDAKLEPKAQPHEIKIEHAPPQKELHEAKPQQIIHTLPQTQKEPHDAKMEHEKPAIDQIAKQPPQQIAHATPHKESEVPANLPTQPAPASGFMPNTPPQQELHKTNLEQVKHATPKKDTHKMNLEHEIHTLPKAQPLETKPKEPEVHHAPPKQEKHEEPIQKIQLPETQPQHEVHTSTKQESHKMKPEPEVHHASSPAPMPVAPPQAAPVHPVAHTQQPAEHAPKHSILPAFLQKLLHTQPTEKAAELEKAPEQAVTQPTAQKPVPPAPKQESVKEASSVSAIPNHTHHTPIVIPKHTHEPAPMPKHTHEPAPVPKHTHEHIPVPKHTHEPAPVPKHTHHTPIVIPKHTHEPAPMPKHTHEPAPVPKHTHNPAPIPKHTHEPVSVQVPQQPKVATPKQPSIPQSIKTFTPIHKPALQAVPAGSSATPLPQSTPPQISGIIPPAPPVPTPPALPQVPPHAAPPVKTPAPTVSQKPSASPAPAPPQVPPVVQMPPLPAVPPTQPVAPISVPIPAPSHTVPTTATQKPSAPPQAPPVAQKPTTLPLPPVPSKKPPKHIPLTSVPESPFVVPSVKMPALASAQKPSAPPPMPPTKPAPVSVPIPAPPHTAPITPPTPPVQSATQKPASPSTPPQTPPPIARTAPAKPATPPPTPPVPKPPAKPPTPPPPAPTQQKPQTQPPPSLTEQQLDELLPITPQHTTMNNKNTPQSKQPSMMDDMSRQQPLRDSGSSAPPPKPQPTPITQMPSQSPASTPPALPTLSSQKPLAPPVPPVPPTSTPAPPSLQKPPVPPIPVNPTPPASTPLPPTTQPPIPPTPSTPPFMAAPPVPPSLQKPPAASPSTPLDAKAGAPPSPVVVPPSDLPTSPNADTMPDQLLGGIGGEKPPAYPEPDDIAMSDDFAGSIGEEDGLEEDNSRRNLFIIVGGVVFALIIIIVLISLITSGGGDDTNQAPTQNTGTDPSVNTGVTEPTPPPVAPPPVEPEEEEEDEEEESTPPATTTPDSGTSDVTSLSSLVPPTPLINPATLTTRELVIRNYTKQELQNALNNVRHLDLSPGTIAYLPVRLEGSVQGLPAYLTAARFFDILDIQVPDTFNQTIDPRFTLYAYSPINEDTQTCREALGRETTKCPGIRLGIVLQRKLAADSDPANLPVPSPQLIGSWIRNTDVSSFKPIILDDITFPNNPSFTSFAFDVGGINYPILYLNLPHSSTTLNFTEVSDWGLIVIATSTNSLYAVLDSLSQDYGE